MKTIAVEVPVVTGAEVVPGERVFVVCVVVTGDPDELPSRLDIDAWNEDVRFDVDGASSFGWTVAAVKLVDP